MRKKTSSIVIVPLTCALLMIAQGYAAGSGGAAGTDGARTRRVPWGVNLHTGDVGWDIEAAERAFDHARDLGCRFVRSDFWWYELEPERGRWNEERFRWFGEYLEAARQKGLWVQVILFGAPGWARNLYRSDPGAFFGEYGEYCGEVAGRFGARVHYYQIWNEADNLFTDFVGLGDDWRLFSSAREALERNDRDFETYVNLTWGFPWWEYVLDSWMKKAGRAVDIIGLDYYPRTWTVAKYENWSPLEKLSAKVTDPTDPCYGKKLAVQETGFSTFFPLWHGERDQRDFINRSLPALGGVIAAHNSKYANRIITCSWYELLDADTSGPAWPEPHFGILRTDWSKKPGYADLKARISEF